ncbi:hypothetical protein DL239_16780 [Sedimentitalea sp. CY04]|uniref:Uncharacterized protein n=1 Tax=Parasedimentitalea denitrificans TaxID=2211118 RepID=A0ABX0WBN4_9RHOB|nr:hypothetical protein [Sedimentitalea sp. CY04]NIZ62628.1 hypothetical protein [Sedimentitalea sp. CY04]
MAEIYLGVNELDTPGIGHGFVGVQSDDGLQVEIHEQPEGGFSPNRTEVIIGGNVPPGIVFRSNEVPDLPTPHHRIPIATLSDTEVKI